MDFPGYFGFHYKNKYYVVRNKDSRKERLGNKIVAEVKQSLLDHSYSLWNSRIDDVQYGNVQKIPESLNEILEQKIIPYELNSVGLPAFKNYSYIINLDTEQLNVYEGYRVINNYYIDLLTLPSF